MAKRFKRKNIKMRIIYIVVSFAILGAGASLLGIQQWYSNSLKPLFSDQQEGKIFVVAPGMTAVEIGQKLEDEGLIRSATAFNWYVDRENIKSSLQAGTYRFSGSQSVQEIATAIAEGKVDSSLVTILPGQRLDEIEEDFISAGFDRKEAHDALHKNYNHPFLANKPKGASLEGYIFPETYEINSVSSVEDVLKKSFDEFNTRLDNRIMTGIKKQGLSVHQAIILASIVQEESGDPTDQKTIAQVFLKRLDEGIILGSDVTFFYAAEVEGKDPSPSLDSPYNTRLYGGLPPGPIANFNMSALHAVAEPADTDYLYFVAGDDGITRFSKTEAEHQALVDKYCIELCKIGSD